MVVISHPDGRHLSVLVFCSHIHILYSPLPLHAVFMTSAMYKTVPFASGDPAESMESLTIRSSH